MVVAKKKTALANSFTMNGKPSPLPVFKKITHRPAEAIAVKAAQTKTMSSESILTSHPNGALKS
jgi:hypothetical protein